MGRAWRTGLVAALLATAAAAQNFSGGYGFLKAIRDANPNDTQKYLDQPGAPVLNARDPNTGEGALHILAKRHDTAWMTVLLARGAQVDLRDKNGDTALMTAATLSDSDVARLLLQYGANPNAADGQGETPLIVAVQHRDLALVQLLVANGADPKRADSLAGKTARDYATEDPRGAAVVKMLDQAKPAAPARAIAGPVRH